MIREALASGVIGRVDRYDPASVRRLSWRLESFRQRRLARSALARRQVESVFLLSGNPSEAERLKAWSALVDQTYEACDAYEPWEAQPRKTPPATLKEAAEKLQATWEAYYGGKMNDPEMQERIARTVKMLERSYTPTTR